MTTICWTVIHHATGSAVHAAVRGAYVARRLVGPVVRRTVQVLRHPASVAAHPQTWFELVCKVIPAAVVGGGLLVPQPLNPPRVPEPPAAEQQPVPPAMPSWWVPGTPWLPWRTPWLPWNGYATSMVIQPPPNLGPPSGPEGGSGSLASEPSTGRLLLTGVGGLVLIRLASRRVHPHSNLGEPLSAAGAH